MIELILKTDNVLCESVGERIKQNKNGTAQSKIHFEGLTPKLPLSNKGQDM